MMIIFIFILSIFSKIVVDIIKKFSGDSVAQVESVDVSKLKQNLK